jgi:signal transduction histidine kinase
VTRETRETLIETATDRELLVLLLKGQDHLDEQLHEVRQFIDENRPALERATRLMHNPVSEYLAARKKAPK